MAEKTIFIPEKIKVGYRERSGTYTGKLAYVIYYGKDGKIRKEVSWEGWRDKKIDPEEFENVPIDGFVLNKKAGGYSTGWNHRSTYCRVYDPRGFEFEITIENLLYILENTNSIKGKGLEGKFTYGWDGGDLILIPVESPDYLSIVKYTDLVKNSSVKTSDLVLGGTYKTSQNEQWIYLGRFERYNDETYESQKDKYGLPQGLHYYFYDGCFRALKSISKRFIEIVSQEPCKEYPELMEQLEKQKFYSPIDFSKDEFVDYPTEEILERVGKNYGGTTVSFIYDDKYYSVRIRQSSYRSPTTYNLENPFMPNYSYWSKNPRENAKLSSFIESKNKELTTIEEFNNAFHFLKLKRYLKNGKLYAEGVDHETK